MSYLVNKELVVKATLNTLSDRFESFIPFILKYVTDTDTSFTIYKLNLDKELFKDPLLKLKLRHENETVFMIDQTLYYLVKE